MWLERQALHDPLTRLPNRLLLMDRTRQALARLHRSQGVVALLFIDLDRFKASTTTSATRSATPAGGGLRAPGRDDARQRHSRAPGRRRVRDPRRGHRGRGRSAGDGRARAAVLAQPFAFGRARVRSSRASACRSRKTPTPIPRTCCTRPTRRCTRPRPRGGRRKELFDDEPASRDQGALGDREPSARRPAPGRAATGLPADPAARRRARRRLRGARALGARRGRPLEAQPPAAVVFLPRAEESELIVQIGDWVLRAVCEQAAAWHRDGDLDPDLDQRVRARADRARVRRARPRPAEGLPPARSRAVPGGERGGGACATPSAWSWR